MTLEEKKAEEYLQSIEGDDCVIIKDREERKQAYIVGYHDAEEHYMNVIDKQHKLVDESKKKRIELLKEAQGYIENIDDVLYDEIEQFLKE